MREVERHAQTAVEAALVDTRVVIVNGARQAGKSTLVHATLRGRPDAVERRLDRATERVAAAADPDSFVQSAGLLALDEVQRVPDLILAIKAAVDEDPRPGRFLLTGSARLLGMRAIPDALVGRSETIELWPFSQGELAGVREGLLDRLFDPDDPPSAARYAPPEAGDLPPATVADRVLRGGFPEAVTRTPPRRARFFDSYIDDLIDRDVTQVADLRRRADLRSLLRRLAVSQAQPVNRAGLGSDVGFPASTLDRYLAAFEEVFLLKLLPAWTSSATPRATAQPKLMFVDPGLGAHLAGVSARTFERDAARFGPFLEGFVLAELARQIGWSETRPHLSHFRNRDGVEVDAILEAGDGRVVGVEVKAARSLHRDDTKHLIHLRDRIGDRFTVGVVVYGGTRAVSLGDRLLALPLDGLWSPTPC